MSTADPTLVDPRLIHNLRKVLTENEELINFLPHIGFGRISPHSSYYQTHKIKFMQNAQQDRCEWDSNAGTSIRICELSPKHITKKSLFQSSHSSRNDETNRFYYKNLYNTNWTGQYNAKRIGVNVDRNIKVKGYILNFNDMKTLIQECFNTYRYDTFIDCVWEIYYVGDRNCVLGISANDGVLYIRQQTIKKLLETNNDEAIQKCLKNLFTCFNFAIKKFENINIRSFESDTCQLVENEVVNKIINSDNYSRKYYHSLGNNVTEQQKLMADVKAFVAETVRNAIKGSVFGIGDKYSYTEILSTIMNNHKKIEKSIFDEGFAKGMRIGMKLEMIGWQPVSINFPDNQNSTDVWWMMDSSIIPSTFIFRGERYEIPEKERKFKIEKLYVNQNGIMRCKGEHPNVSGSKVCMGDLNIDFSKSVADIQDALERAKALLDIINYDSAYNSSSRDALVKCSTKIRSLSLNELDEKGQQIIKKPTRIREVSFDDDDKEEVIVNDNIPIVHDNHVIAEAIPVTDPDERNDRRRYGIASDDIIEEQISVPTYVVSNNNVDTLENVRVVNETGERRPVVFYAANGDVVSAPITTNSVDSRELALGDSNLL